MIGCYVYVDDLVLVIDCIEFEDVCWFSCVEVEVVMVILVCGECGWVFGMLLCGVVVYYLLCWWVECG